MSKIVKLIIIIILCVIALITAVGVGSVRIEWSESVRILLNRLFNAGFQTDATNESILWQVRLPRVILAFIAGGGLAVSGVVMQSTLRNPLASSSTLGVSSGAAVGASLVILLNLSVFGRWTGPLFGFGFGLVTVFAAIALASRLSKDLESTAVILTGMAFSFLGNAVITIIMSLARQEINRLVFWQMGSFALKNWSYPAMLFPVAVLGILVIQRYAREMDMMTLGDEQALTSGVELKKTKWILLSAATVITGATISMTGIIGFVDLFTPHVARRLFGASHRYVVVASALLGGLVMVACDLVARTALSPMELPVGAVTSLIGAPFFLYLYFGGGRKQK